MPPTDEMTLKERVWVATLAAALGTLYSFGACPTIYVGDSGELVTAAATLGIPHPSGYPLYVILGKLWIEVFRFGSVAFRMSLFSAFWAAAACAFLYLTGRRLGLSRAGATLSALLLGLSPSFWSQANVQRVYSLNAFFLVAATYLTLAWHQTRRPWLLVVGAFVTGLGASNHTFMAVFGIAAGVFALATEPALLRRPKVVVSCLGAAVAGLLPYLYLPLRSRMDPVLDRTDPETLGRLLAVILRRDFWGRSWIESPWDFVAIFLDYFASLGNELLWGGAALAIIGAIGAIGAWSQRWVMLLLLVMAVNLLTMALHGSQTDLFIWHRYYIPSYAAAALLAGCGWQSLRERAERGRLSKRVIQITLALALLLPAALAWRGFSRFDRSAYDLAEDYSRTLLDSLPHGSNLIASGDSILFPLLYLHFVEGVRPDLNLILQGPGRPESQRPIDPYREPVYFTSRPYPPLPGLELVPIGLAYRTARPGRPPPPPKVVKWELDGENDPRVPKDYLSLDLIGQFHYMLGETFERLDWPVAQEKFAQAAAVVQENDVLFYNLGIIYRRNGLPRRSLSAFERATAINPRHLADRPGVRASERSAEVRDEVARLELLEARYAATRAAPPGKAAFHRDLADFLEAEGEGHLAQGQRRLALELERKNTG